MNAAVRLLGVNYSLDDLAARHRALPSAEEYGMSAYALNSPKDDRAMRFALAENRRVADGVQLFIQFGSQHIRQYAEDRGYIDIFERAGATLVDPSCGACIRAGPGVSSDPSQVTVSAINRNFPGRSGPGKVYLASPLVVAASAVAGRIVAPEV